MIRGIWNRETVALLVISAILPIIVAWLLAGGWGAALRLATVVIVVAIWQLVWMLARAQPPSLSGVVTAAAVAILAPPELAGPALILSVSFGVVFGELAFGGWGRNILNPATVALAFAGFGFPAAAWPVLPVELGWAAVPAAAIGASLGILSARLILGALLILAGAIWLDPGLWEGWAAASLVLVILVADPVSSAATQAGRWLNGALYAALFVLFSATWTAAAAVQVAVSAALLASLAAPLLDDLAIRTWLAERRRRHG